MKMSDIPFALTQWQDNGPGEHFWCSPFYF